MTLHVETCEVMSSILVSPRVMSCLACRLGIPSRVVFVISSRVMLCHVMSCHVV